MNRTLHTAAATLMAASALITVAACSSADRTFRPARTGPAVESPGNTGQARQSASPPTEAFTQLKGDNGISGKIHSVQRRDGMVLVKFEVTNHNDKPYLTVDWRDEIEAYTLAGSSLVDRTNKKRYMALLDSSGRCLCSEHTGSVDKGQTKQLYVQFEAPPKDVTRVDLALGTLSVVTVPIQEG